MATSSILGGTQLPEPVSGKDTGALGPSDTSDTGSDATGVFGADEMSSDSDAEGTGERATLGGRDHPGADILPDHVENMGEEDADDMADDRVDPDELAADDDEEDEDNEEDNDEVSDADDDMEGSSG